MSSSTYPFIIPFDSDIEDVFSSTNTPDYTPASPNYFPASPGNTSLDPSNDLTKDLLASLAFSPFHDDPYMKVMTSTLEMIVKDIQVRHRSDKKDLLDAIYELKNRKEGPPDY
uniref:Reverse transcriptase domain-containing protein n=1 Tax=Tanacetum cinerariifolium TaxID=118510 RepID=A0A6L2LVF8_TANCI|nr:hypothetical protein [Tanacetum cinerariifolium]